jgi:hypothetical protein
MTKRLVLLATLATMGMTASSALADSGGATIRSLPESEEIQVTAEVHHNCPEYLSEPDSTCDWFAEASTYSSSVECPITFDASHSAWSGELQTTPGASDNTFAILPYGLPRDIHVCLYIYAENESTLVGQSHTFDRTSGRELIPHKSTTRECGTVSATKLNWDVSIYEGPESCATARKVLGSYLHGSGKPDHKTSFINGRLLSKGWLCGEVGKEPTPACIRETHGHSELVLALPD